jgi:hypothetical protein
VCTVFKGTEPKVKPVVCDLIVKVLAGKSRMMAFQLPGHIFRKKVSADQAKRTRLI